MTDGLSLLLSDYVVSILMTDGLSLHLSDYVVSILMTDGLSLHLPDYVVTTFVMMFDICTLTIQTLVGTQVNVHLYYSTTLSCQPRTQLHKTSAITITHSTLITLLPL